MGTLFNDNMKGFIILKEIFIKIIMEIKLFLKKLIRFRINF